MSLGTSWGKDTPLQIFPTTISAPSQIDWILDTWRRHSGSLMSCCVHNEIFRLWLSLFETFIALVTSGWGSAFCRQQVSRWVCARIAIEFPHLSEAPDGEDPPMSSANWLIGGDRCEGYETCNCLFDHRIRGHYSCCIIWLFRDFVLNARCVDSALSGGHKTAIQKQSG